MTLHPGSTLLPVDSKSLHHYSSLLLSLLAKGRWDREVQRPKSREQASLNPFLLMEPAGVGQEVGAKQAVEVRGASNGELPSTALMGCFNHRLPSPTCDLKDMGEAL